MGSMITLGVEKFEIDWGKNNVFNDHSVLFLPSDIAPIPYYYADNVIEIKDGLSRKLGAVKKRLDLLGYTPLSLARKYEDSLRMVPDYYSEIPISFEQFASIIKSINLKKVAINRDSDDCDDYNLGEFVSSCGFMDKEVSQHLPSDIVIDNDLGTFFENLDPYITLRLLAENEKNIDRLVQWRYADVVENGWVSIDEVVNPLPDKFKILIVTEGSSDSFIIQRAMNELCSDIADFFYFVDMEDNYPFTGSGNLFRFCQGLSRIKIQNNVMAIFDNDAAGIENLEKSKRLQLPRNMHICKLPDHKSFSRFRTVGPNGESFENINGSAVSIECFLDLDTIKPTENYVRWTSYNRQLERYQGELEGKDMLVRAFKHANLTDGGYNTDKLNFLLDYLVDQWVTSSDYY